MLERMTLARSGAPWRIAVTRDEPAERPLQAALEAAAFRPFACPVMIEAPAPEPARLAAVARDLGSYDWIICSSARGVRAVSDARGSNWPSGPRTAAVGAVTAAAMIAAGTYAPVVADTFNARALWARLKPLVAWPQQRVLIVTVAGGRRELVDAVRAEGATVDEIEAYAMVPRPAEDIRREWAHGRPDALILASPSSVRHLLDAIGRPALDRLKAIVPIGQTTAAAISAAGLRGDPPGQATFTAVVERLIALRAAEHPRLA
jgi:uroporphyrinogen-III synthase